MLQVEKNLMKYNFVSNDGKILTLDDVSHAESGSLYGSTFSLDGVVYVKERRSEYYFDPVGRTAISYMNMLPFDESSEHYKQMTKSGVVLAPSPNERVYIPLTEIGIIKETKAVDYVVMDIRYFDTCLSALRLVRIDKYKPFSYMAIYRERIDITIRSVKIEIGARGNTDPDRAYRVIYLDEEERPVYSDIIEWR